MSLPARTLLAAAVVIFAAALAFGNRIPGMPGFFDRELGLGLDLRGGTALTYRVDLSKVEPARQAEIYDGVREVLEKRVNALGISEATVVPASAGAEKLLVVELPGVDDLAAARDRVGKVVTLEFFEPKDGGGWAETPSLSGEHFQFADVAFDQYGRPEVAVTFNEAGAKLFGEVTSRRVGQPVAIFLDGQLLTAPTIQAPITGGQARITGNYSLKEATDLAKNLNTGAIPAPVALIGESTVGPTLGAAQLTKSLRAAAWGLVLVGIFMVIFYRVAGAIATLALGIYGVVLLALFKLLGIALTLAGVAGFILSLGMAVDANVLIFERMREEFLREKNFRKVVSVSFARAWEAIRDSNFSTLLTCAILFFFGSGLVRGFSLTLGVGVVVSMLTAIFVTRVIVEIVGQIAPLARPGVMVSKK